jgi:hypothetical protein
MVVSLATPWLLLINNPNRSTWLPLFQGASAPEHPIAKKLAREAGKKRETADS